VNAALQVLGDDLVAFGYFTPTIIITDTDLTRLEYKRRAVQQILDQQGLVSSSKTRMRLKRGYPRYRGKPMRIAVARSYRRPILST